MERSGPVRVAGSDGKQCRPSIEHLVLVAANTHRSFDLLPVPPAVDPLTYETIGRRLTTYDTTGRRRRRPNRAAGKVAADLAKPSIRNNRSSHSHLSCRERVGRPASATRHVLKVGPSQYKPTPVGSDALGPLSTEIRASLGAEQAARVRPRTAGLVRTAVWSEPQFGANRSLARQAGAAAAATGASRPWLAVAEAATRLAACAARSTRIISVGSSSAGSR
jgi:hypothetical protein